MHDMVVGRKTIGHENTCHLLASTFITHTFALSSPVIHSNWASSSKPNGNGVHHNEENKDFYYLSIKAKFA